MAKRPPTNSRTHNASERIGSVDAECAKNQLAQRIIEAIRTRGLTQAATAELLGIDQPKVSRLVRGRLSEFSVSRLMRFINLLGRDIEIIIYATREDAPGHQGHLRVVATNRIVL